jgi:hypothetical protein
VSGIVSTGSCITSTTDYFKFAAGEEQETDPGRHGKTLAQWLARRLEERGVSVEDILPEDFGRVVMLSRKPFPPWLACGNTDDSETEWSVSPVAEASLFRRLIKRTDLKPEIEELREHLSAPVSSIPGVCNVVRD